LAVTICSNAPGLRMKWKCVYMMQLLDNESAKVVGTLRVQPGLSIQPSNVIDPR